MYHLGGSDASPFCAAFSDFGAREMVSMGFGSRITNRSGQGVLSGLRALYHRKLDDDRPSDDGDPGDSCGTRLVTSICFGRPRLMADREDLPIGDRHPRRRHVPISVDLHCRGKYRRGRNTRSDRQHQRRGRHLDDAEHPGGSGNSLLRLLRVNVGVRGARPFEYRVEFAVGTTNGGASWESQTLPSGLAGAAGFRARPPRSASPLDRVLLPR